MAKADRVQKASDGRFTVIFGGKSRGRFKSKSAAVAKLAELGGGGRGGRGGRGGGGGGRGGSGTQRVQLVDPIKDPTPSRPAQRAKPELSMGIRSQNVRRFMPEDKLALGLAFVFACRSMHAGFTSDDAEIQQIINRWFGESAGDGLLPEINLVDEVTLFLEMFEAMPVVLEKTGFTFVELGQCWEAITKGEVVGLPAAPAVPGAAAGPSGIGGALFAPVVGTVTRGFTTGHPAVDIGAPIGTPVRAPEDIKVTKVKRTFTPGAGFGQHVVGVSRKPDGSWPTGTGLFGGGEAGLLIPAEGVRRHLFAHLDSIARPLKVGDELAAGSVLGRVGSTGRSTGPHLHWATDLYFVPSVREPFKLGFSPMNPGDLVPLDVLGGTSARRPPSPTWTVVDPDKPEATRKVASYDIRVGGDLIFKGRKTVVETDVEADVDIGLLSSPISPRGAPTGFDALSDPRVAEMVGRQRRAGGRGILPGLGRLAGTVGGAVFGGPLGAVAGRQAGAGAGGLLENLFFGGGRGQSPFGVGGGEGGFEEPDPTLTDEELIEHVRRLREEMERENGDDDSID